MNKRPVFLTVFLLGVLTSSVFLLCTSRCIASGQTNKKKILYIDSYSMDYVWSADITAGIQSVLAGRKDIKLKIFRMDTKRNKSEFYKKHIALQAKKLIDSWQPDVVIASDDNASKYLVAPYYRGGRLPFVFCGLNWDASVYGFPASNVTGMIEVALYRQTIDMLRQFARGDRIGYLSSDVVTERKALKNISKRFKTHFTVRFVKTFAELKQAFLELQKETDMILIQECRSVLGFNHREMVHFINKNTTVPTGALQRYRSHYALLTYAKVGEEQGEYAAKTALEILAGKSPQEIPVTANKKAKIYLNMLLAKKLGIKFPLELIENAHLISAKQKKLFYVNSYHKGYKWSDDIEKGLFKALNVKVKPDGSFDTSKSEVVVKLYRMNTKLHKSESYKHNAALTAKKIIDEWQPDIVVTSDDNAARYLIVPYYKNSALPFVFCGINWNASIYGLPTRNITGMVEVAPGLETVAMLKKYALGNDLGYIGGENLSNRRTKDNFTQVLGLHFSDGKFVTTYEEWKREYLKLQDTVDMLLWFNPIGIKGWDTATAIHFILANTKIPTGGTSDHNVRFALLGKVKIAEEQGWWAGKTALKILEGTSPADIPVATNRKTRVYLNMELAKRLGIKFPMELLEQASFVKPLSD
ncbi:MAG TPA: hypothetical protein ENI88_09810 [Desulfobulbus sp.]|nr:hypothetical protein [Desulfobulbus sp.]